MKTKTDWSGIEFNSETPKEKELLKNLFLLIKKDLQNDVNLTAIDNNNNLCLSIMTYF